MMEEEVSKLYSRIAFQYEAMLDMFTAKGLIDEDLATGTRETCTHCCFKPRQKLCWSYARTESILAQNQAELFPAGSCSIR